MLFSLFLDYSLFGNKVGLVGNLGNSPNRLVDVLQMASQVSALSKVLVADLTMVRSLHCVLAKVVPQVTAFAEDGVTPGELAEEHEFCAFGLAVGD